MPVKIVRGQIPTHYFNKYHLPVLSEVAATALSELTKRRYCKKLLGKNPLLFSTIEIETYNRCNNDCPFCPANKNVDKRSPVFMDQKLFSKIADDLCELNYRGNVSLFHNNEPLLDKRLPDFVREIRAKVTDSSLSIWTNGILLNVDKLGELFLSGFMGRNCHLLIDNYSDDGQMNLNIRKLLDDIRGSQLEREIDITVAMRKKNAFLTSRGGNSPNKIDNQINRIDQILIWKQSCRYPFDQFNVNPIGKVHICCNDVYYENIIGDLNNESIIQVWGGEKIRKIRMGLCRDGRKSIIPCNKCDTLTMEAPYVLMRALKLLAFMDGRR